MGILDKVKKRQKDKQKEEQKKLEQKIYKELSEDELKYLLTLISKSEFIGKDLQIIYSIVAKLQNQLNQ
jgi:ATP-dependent DNA ligase